MVTSLLTVFVGGNHNTKRKLLENLLFQTSLCQENCQKNEINLKTLK